MRLTHEEFFHTHHNHGTSTICLLRMRKDSLAAIHCLLRERNVPPTPQFATIYERFWWIVDLVQHVSFSRCCCCCCCMMTSRCDDRIVTLLHTCHFVRSDASLTFLVPLILPTTGCDGRLSGYIRTDATNRIVRARETVELLLRSSFLCIQTIITMIIVIIIDRYCTGQTQKQAMGSERERDCRSCFVLFFFVFSFCFC